MSVWQIILGVALFALAAAILYVWGLKKSLAQKEELEHRLMHACGSRVVRQLKKQDTITRAEIAALIDGMTAGPFWSKQRVRVQDGEKVTGQLVEFLLDQQYIRKTEDGTYRLRK